MGRPTALHFAVTYINFVSHRLALLLHTAHLTNLQLVVVLDARNAAAQLQAARALAVHERTVRYRLARIAKLTALDLQHSDDRFRLELAIRGARLLGEAPAR